MESSPPSRCTHHAGSPVMRLDVLLQLIPVDALDVGDRPQDGTSQWAVLEGRCMQMIKDQLAVLLVHLEWVDT